LPIIKSGTKEIIVETDILSRDVGYIFVQGYAIFDGIADYIDPATVWQTGNGTDGIAFIPPPFSILPSTQRLFLQTAQFPSEEYLASKTAENRLNWYVASTTILSSELEFIQVPTPNDVNIEYVPDPDPGETQNLYINDVLDLPNPTEGDYGLSVVFLNSSFNNTLGLIYPQVPNSGYDSTIYPFEFPPEYQIDFETYIGLVLLGPSAFGQNISFLGSFLQISSPPMGTLEYEIRFNADENQTYPIIGVINIGDLFALIIVRPRTAVLTSDTPDAGGPVPIENYQSFLIRRWIPRAGYIYLDVDAPLGKGIVKPEFITKTIQDKIPQIIKELTDKGLIQ
jgi:hypothetical protein